MVQVSLSISVTLSVFCWLPQSGPLWCSWSLSAIFQDVGNFSMPENMVLHFIAIFVMRSSVLDNDLRLAKFNIDIML